MFICYIKFFRKSLFDKNRPNLNWLRLSLVYVYFWSKILLILYSSLEFFTTNITSDCCLSSTIMKVLENCVSKMPPYSEVE